MFDIKEKNVLITGATSGIGKAAALKLSLLGAKIYFIARNQNKAEDLTKEIKNLSGMASYPIIADLSSQNEIKKAADEFKSLNIPLHVLLNNAGLINMERNETVDGFEEVFALNHLAYYSLTQLLLDNIINGSPSRIVNVSSGAHAFVKGFNFDDVQSLNSYKPFQVYGHSKLANILFTKKLASLLKDENVTVNCLHPGVVGTAFGQNNGSLQKVLFFIIKPFIRSSEKGAESSVYLCSSPEVSSVTGEYFYNCKIEKTTKWAKSEEDADRLWLLSRELTGI
ncbi:MAG: SDR family oxidoreductase [Pseudomonadota bacterium]|nr:SDR family oxidoreductase [Pseudomonadota bacterium]MEC9414443.1 SDR family oxidoreductase [Pseudomonadota bacterium]